MFSRVFSSYLLVVISLDDFVQRPIPPKPLKPSVDLHWLAVNGIQPSIPQNPSIIESTTSIIPPTLPKELQVGEYQSINLDENNMWFLFLS